MRSKIGPTRLPAARVPRELVTCRIAGSAVHRSGRLNCPLRIHDVAALRTVIDNPEGDSIAGLVAVDTPRQRWIKYGVACPREVAGRKTMVGNVDVMRRPLATGRALAV